MSTRVISEPWPRKSSPEERGGLVTIVGAKDNACSESTKREALGEIQS